MPGLDDVLKVLAAVYGAMLLGVIPLALIALALLLWRRRDLLSGHRPPSAPVPGSGPKGATAGGHASPPRGPNPMNTKGPATKQSAAATAAETQRPRAAEARTEVLETAAVRAAPSAPVPGEGADPQPQTDPTPETARPALPTLFSPWSRVDEPTRQAQLHWAVGFSERELEPHLAVFDPEEREIFLADLVQYREWFDHENNKDAVRARRQTLAEAKERTRVALRPLSSEGFYVFEDLATDEAGLIDQLVVGRHGIVVIMVRHEDGTVWLSPEGLLGLYPRNLFLAHEKNSALDPRESAEKRQTEPKDYIFSPFEEDLQHVLADLVGDVERNLFPAKEPVPDRFAELSPVHALYCFPIARVGTFEDGGRPSFCTPVYDLAAMMLEARGRETLLSEEEVEYFAGRIEHVYGREPWVRPGQEAAREA